MDNLLKKLGRALLRSMIGAPILRWSLWGGIPDGCSELRNSIGKCTASSRLSTVSIEENVIFSPGSSSRSSLLTLSTVSFLNIEKVGKLSLLPYSVDTAKSTCEKVGKLSLLPYSVDTAKSTCERKTESL